MFWPKTKIVEVKVIEKRYGFEYILLLLIGFLICSLTYEVRFAAEAKRDTAFRIVGWDNKIFLYFWANTETTWRKI